MTAKEIVIKVTDGESRCYFCHFDRKAPHDLLKVFEHKVIFTPTMGVMANRTKAVINAARSKIPETAGEVQ